MNRYVYMNAVIRSALWRAHAQQLGAIMPKNVTWGRSPQSGNDVRLLRNVLCSTEKLFFGHSNANQQPLEPSLAKSWLQMWMSTLSSIG